MAEAHDSQKPPEVQTSTLSASSSPSGSVKKYDARSVSWENIPVWQNHIWSRASREVSVKLPTPPPTISEAETPSNEVPSSDSDESDSSESDEDIDDPLATPSTTPKPKKSRFPINLELNGRISLWYAC
jgi:hypothetical protein